MDEITLFPSNWLYNSAVIGFLKVLSFGESKRVLKNPYEITAEGSVSISKHHIKVTYKLLHDYHKEKLKEEFKIWGGNKRYKNYIQSKQKNFFENHYLESLQAVTVDNTRGKCSWCVGYYIPNKHLEKLAQEWGTSKKEKQQNNSRKNRKDDGFVKFMVQREKFQGIHIKELGGAITEMPNAFWGLEFSTPICHLCSYLIIFHHLAFSPMSKNQEIFINTPHFGLTWDLNEFLDNILQNSAQFELRKILGTSLLEWSIKRRALLGAWTIRNIEMVVKTGDTIDYFDLPYHITRILLDYDIARLINTISEEKIFDLILRGKFSEIEKANYFILRALIKLKNRETLPENDPVKKYVNSWNNFNHISKIASLLPELLAKISKILNMEVKNGEEKY